MSLDLKPVEIKDREIFSRYFKEDPPEISELTFTNLFMWQGLYRPVWTELDDVLLIIFNPEGTAPFGLQPVGPGNKAGALGILLDYLADTDTENMPCL